MRVNGLKGRVVRRLKYQDTELCGLSDDTQRGLREVQEHFRLLSVGLVEKDRYVIEAIAA
jgi:hypothetical protein